MEASGKTLAVSPSLTQQNLASSIAPDATNITREDVIECAKEMGIPEEAITDDILAQVKKGVEWGLECWSEVVKEAISMSLKS